MTDRSFFQWLWDGITGAPDGEPVEIVVKRPDAEPIVVTVPAERLRDDLALAERLRELPQKVKAGKIVKRRKVAAKKKQAAAKRR